MGLFYAAWRNGYHIAERSNESMKWLSYTLGERVKWKENICKKKEAKISLTNQPNEPPTLHIYILLYYLDIVNFVNIHFHLLQVCFKDNSSFDYQIIIFILINGKKKLFLMYSISNRYAGNVTNHSFHQTIV